MRHHTPMTLAFDAMLGTGSGIEMTALHLTLQCMRQQIAMVAPLMATSAGVGFLDADDITVLRNLYDQRPPLMAAIQALPPEESLPATLVRALGRDLRGYPTPLGRRFARRAGLTALTDTALDASARARGDEHDLLLAGSAWQADLLRAAGFRHVHEWRRGVDVSRFAPGPRTEIAPGRFVIFSAGRLDARKGQDLVIAAFRAFRAKHPDALLVTAWQDPWPEQVVGFPGSPFVEGVPEVHGGALQIVPWLAANRIPANSVVDLGLLHNPQLAILLRGVDVAVFPSRAEAEPHGAALECLATGVPTIIADNTGQHELAQAPYVWSLEATATPRSVPPGVTGTDGWGEARVEQIVALLEQIHAQQKAARLRAAAAVPDMARRSWAVQARQFVDLLQGRSAGAMRAA
jgi:glycosyltransferase involved in cell wall biosynthesis